jgi:phosphoserine phosphatase RsbU/P
MVTAQLHTMFRTLIPFDLRLEDLMTRASALLCASSLPAQYATLVCGYLTLDGDVVISNAGHPPPLVISADRQADVRATGVPMGMFCEAEFSTTQLRFAPGDTLFAYTDGLTEATNAVGREYSTGEVEACARRLANADVDGLIDGQLGAQARFRGHANNSDDLTVLAIRRTVASGDDGLTTVDRRGCDSL